MVGQSLKRMTLKCQYIEIQQYSGKNSSFPFYINEMLFFCLEFFYFIDGEDHEINTK